MSAIIAFLASKAIGLGLPSKFAKPAAIGFLCVVAIALLWGAKAAYDSNLIQSYVSEANEEFLEKKDEVSGKADEQFEKDQDALEVEIRTTEGLINDAIKNGCAVGEYLASNGTNCVLGNGDRVPRTGP